MAEALTCVAPQSVIVGWDFSTGAVKCLAFELDGRVLAEVRLPTDLWRGDPDTARASSEKGISELNLTQLEGQARASARAMGSRLRELGRLGDWAACGISATHHTSGRIDRQGLQVRRAICWNDQTLPRFHKLGLRRLGGQPRVVKLLGGPWASRYSLSHLVKDELLLSEADWQRTYRIASHGTLAAGYLTDNFDVVSVSSAASTGLMDFRKRKWCKTMLQALDNPRYRKLAWKQLPTIIAADEPIGPLSASVLTDLGIDASRAPIVFPTLDDQAAGLVGGGAVNDGQMAIILGTSAVVNSSASRIPALGDLDVMRLNWGPYLWMRCYHNGAELINHFFGSSPDHERLERQARACAVADSSQAVLPFLGPEPALKVGRASLRWAAGEPSRDGVKYRACLESIAYLIALGVRAHERAGQEISRITVSGGIARSDLMCEILASVLGRSLARLESAEGPALGAAVTALAGLEMHRRRARGLAREFTVEDAVQTMVRFRQSVEPRAEWHNAYRAGLAAFEKQLAKARADS